MPNFLPHPVEKAVLRFFEDLATPVSRKVKTFYEEGRWDDLASCEVDPRHYDSAYRYWLDCQAVGLLKKLPELPTTFDRKLNAEDTFLECERRCLASNQRLYPYLTPGVYSDSIEGVSDFFQSARKNIKRILGPCPQDLEGRHGPGATFGDMGRLCTIPDKMSSVPTLTSDAWPSLFNWVGTAWASACAASDRGPKFVEGNRFTTVPKDAKKDRGIAIEPSINVFYQLAYGRAIRHRLSRSGVNLNEGQDIHRQVACEASIRGHLSTLDLSNASDTVCRNLVKLLLPPDWFEAIDCLRSKKTLFRERWVLLEKFSSMGNGFTFELETLIFLGLAMTVHTDMVPGVNTFVYGDDIIVPVQHAKAVISVLKFCGMVINEKKSFIDGPFRESCGGDFFLGVDVRPHFQKVSPSEPQHFIAFANGIRRSTHWDANRWSDSRNLWFSLLDQIPSQIRGCRGPEDLGDIVIHDEANYWSSQTGSDWIRRFRVYKPSRFTKVSWENFKPDVVLASALYGVPEGGGGVIPRSSVQGYRLAWYPAYAGT